MVRIEIMQLNDLKMAIPKLRLISKDEKAIREVEKFMKNNLMCLYIVLN